MVRIRKHVRNSKVVSLRSRDPKKWSLRKLGEEFNISYVRVKQILDEPEKLSTPTK